MATHSSILAGKIPRTEGPGQLQSLGSQRVGLDWATEHTCTYIKSPNTCVHLSFLKKTNIYVKHKYIRQINTICLSYCMFSSQNTSE